jgi:hypothetical protein
MPVSLTEVTSWVESSTEIDAIRTEPSLLANNPAWVSVMVPKIAECNACSLYTARTIACTSYGLFQMLGANIYTFYNGKIRAWWNDMSLQEQAFASFAKRLGFDANADVTQWSDEMKNNWALHYNGPGAVPDYVAAFNEKIQLILKGE